MTTFKILLPEKLVGYPHFQEPDLIDISPLELAIINLTKKYALTEWCIEFGDMTQTMHLEAISQIWADIPQALNDVLSDERSGKLDFFEQGYQQVIIMRSISEDKIRIEFVDYLNKSENAETITCSSHQVISEWRAFAIKLINLTIEAQLIQSNEQSIEEYIGSLPQK